MQKRMQTQGWCPHRGVAWLLSASGVRGSLIFSSVHIILFRGLSALTAVGALSLPPQPQLPSPPHTPSPPRCGNQRGATRPQSRREAITLSFLSLRCLTLITSSRTFAATATRAHVDKVTPDVAVGKIERRGRQAADDGASLRCEKLVGYQGRAL